MRYQTKRLGEHIFEQHSTDFKMMTFPILKHLMENIQSQTTECNNYFFLKKSSEFSYNYKDTTRVVSISVVGS